MSASLNRTIFAPSAVRLFGRVLMGTTGPQPGGRRGAGAAAAAPGPGGVSVAAPGNIATALPDYARRSLLFQSLDVGNLNIAHIFAYSYEGSYKPLHVPATFLVEGVGTSVFHPPGVIDPAQLGLAQLDGTITFATDLVFWIYDRADLIIRLDLNSGTLQTLVIDAETGGGRGRRIDLVGQDGSFSGRLGQGSY
jgi:hypothetical protein